MPTGARPLSRESWAPQRWRRHPDPGIGKLKVGGSPGEDERNFCSSALGGRLVSENSLLAVTSRPVGIGSSTRLDPGDAGREAADLALASLSRAAVADAGALVLATAAYGASGLPALFECVEETLGMPTLGASVHGVLAPGLEVSENPAVVVLVLGGLEFEPFQLDASDLVDVAAQLPATRTGDLAVVLPDGTAGHAGGALVPALSAALAPATVVGVATAEVQRGHGLTWCHGDLLEGACAGFVSRPARALRVGVTQACRLVGGVHDVTRSRGSWVAGIAGEPAIDRYLEHAGVLGDGLESLAMRLLVGVGPRATPGRELGAAGLRIRRAVGFDRARGAIGLPDEVRNGSVIAFAIPDEAIARADLQALVRAAAGEAPALLALYFSCTSRGAALFQHAGLEAGLLESGLPGTPFVGAQGPFQVGPLVARCGFSPLPGEEAEVLTRAGVLALLS